MKNEKVIEFDKIKQVWSQFAITDWAKASIIEVSPFLSENELRTNLRMTTEGRKMIEMCGNPPLVSMEGIETILVIANSGSCLTPEQLERVESILVAVKRLKNYLSRGKHCQNSLAFYESEFDELEELKGEIKRQIRNGLVDDYASKFLLQTRNEISRIKNKMKEKAETIIRSNKECMTDTFSTIRNGRICVPVKKEYKFKISGNIIDKSSTGNTLFIEPISIAKYYDDLELLKIDEENEVYRILYILTDMVARSGGIIKSNIQLIEKLDFIFSKSKLSIELDAVEPMINTNREIILKDARHPLMEKEVCIPLQFSLGIDTKGVVITGPNTGGKTVAIKTVALNCIMAQSGLHVTCREANICMNSNYLCDLGDGQNLSENLSTFSAHIKNVLSILNKVNSESLVIMDELGSGTDPTEGMGIAIAILEELRKSECLFLVTTHYPEVKLYADNSKRIANARMTFDKETLMPTYQMIIGEAGESCAFHIANRIGMPNEMIKTAIKAAYGEEAIKQYEFIELENNEKQRTVSEQEKIQKLKQVQKGTRLGVKYRLGDSVMVYPDKKIGIVCQLPNKKGILEIQMANKRIAINQKRVKLLVASTELYPEDYDFSIIFDTVKNRKIRHDMERKFTKDIIEL